MTDTTQLQLHAAFESPLAGFIDRLPAGARFAIYPLGRYTRACVEDLAPGRLESNGRRLLGFIDDGASRRAYFDRPVAPLRDVAAWPLDAILLLRDTADNALQQRVSLLQSEGMLRGVTLITQPTETLDAMLAHQATYEPSTPYSPAFAAACARREAEFSGPPTASTLLCTLDAEVFPHADVDAAWRYPMIMREFMRLLRDFGYSATLCVQLRDTPAGMRRTPPAVVEVVLDSLGPDAIALHGIDHAMPSDGYAVEWLESGLAELRSRYGVGANYWAPPGWSLNWRTLGALARAGIRYTRGIRTGVNVRRKELVETLRRPYRVGGITQIPYSYVDWMFADVHGTPLCRSDITTWHDRLADFAAERPCCIETVAHPFRLVGPDWRERLNIVRETLELYAKRSVSISRIDTELIDSCTRDEAMRRAVSQ